MGILGTFVKNGFIPYHWGCCRVAACEGATQCTEKVITGMCSFLPAVKSKLLSNEAFLGIYTLSVALWYLLSDKKNSDMTDEPSQENLAKKSDKKGSSSEASAGKSIFEGKIKEPIRRGILRKPNQEPITSSKDSSPKSSTRRIGQPQIIPPFRTPESFKPAELPSTSPPTQDSQRKIVDEATSSAQTIQKSSTFTIDKPETSRLKTGFCECRDRECEGMTSSDWGRTTSAETSVEFPSGFACEPIDRCPHCGLFHTVNQNALNRRNVPTRNDASIRLAMGDSDIDVVDKEKVVKQVLKEIGSTQGKNKMVSPQTVKLDSSANSVKRPPVLKQTTRAKNETALPMKGKQRVTFNFDKNSRFHGNNMVK